MLKIILQLFRPSVALTALILLGGWQGYTFMRDLPDRIGLPDFRPEVQNDVQETAPDEKVGTEEVQETIATEDLGPVTAAIRRRSGIGRTVLWVIFYTLLCFGCVPMIKKVLESESNLANALLLAGFSAGGIILATALTGFRFDLFRIILLLCASAYSLGLIFILTNELENMRA